MYTINTPYFEFTWPIIKGKVRRLVEVSSCIETPVIATMQCYNHLALSLYSLEEKKINIYRYLYKILGVQNINLDNKPSRL